jgi:uncharacterized protein YndB with AHSA1/START domain
MMNSKAHGPVAQAQMAIRKPIAEVFEAFVNPAITTRFWFTKSSGRLEAGKTVRWEWEMYGFSTNAEVKEIENHKRILVEWNRPDHPSMVEWTFEQLDKNRTFVTVKNWGFGGDAGKTMAAAIDSTGGFTFLLAGAKFFLEHGIEPRLVEDHDPKAALTR